MPQRGRELLARHGQAHGLLAVPIEHSRDRPAIAQPLGMARPGILADFDIQYFGHDRPRFNASSRGWQWPADLLAPAPAASAGVAASGESSILPDSARNSTPG